MSSYSLILKWAKEVKVLLKKKRLEGVKTNLSMIISQAKEEVNMSTEYSIWFYKWIFEHYCSGKLKDSNDYMRYAKSYFNKLNSEQKQVIINKYGQHCKLEKDFYQLELDRARKYAVDKAD